MNPFAAFQYAVVFNAPARPRIVCLCGSTRFMKEFYDANMRETLAGKIVLTVGMSSHGDCKPNEEQKIALDELHKRKIDLADEILVLNVGGYVGDSTRSEIEYAAKRYRGIRWLEPDKAMSIEIVNFTPKVCDAPQG